jgi:hypothetical protein
MRAAAAAAAAFRSPEEFADGIARMVAEALRLTRANRVPSGSSADRESEPAPRSQAKKRKRRQPAAPHRLSGSGAPHTEVGSS